MLESAPGARIPQRCHDLGRWAITISTAPLILLSENRQDDRDRTTLARELRSRRPGVTSRTPGSTVLRGRWSLPSTPGSVQGGVPSPRLPLSAADVRSEKFLPTRFRDGYSPDQVDALLDQVAATLEGTAACASCSGGVDDAPSDVGAARAGTGPREDRDTGRAESWSDDQGEPCAPPGRPSWPGDPAGREDHELLGRPGHRDVPVDSPLDTGAERVRVDEDDEVELESLGQLRCER